MRRLLLLAALPLALASFATAACTALIGLPDVPADASLEGGEGIGWWSGDVDGGEASCFSARTPTVDERPGSTDPSEIAPIYLAMSTIRFGTDDATFQSNPNAWQDIGMDIDGVCTNSPTCLQDDPLVSCTPPATAIPYDGDYCRDNTFGKLEVQAASIPEVGGKYGLNDDAFNCALCTGAYTFLIKISNYNGTPNDDSVRIDLYPSPGLETVLQWNCQDPNWREHPCFTADMPWLVRDTAVAQDAGGPNLPDAILADPNAYVRDGYIVAQLPPDTLFWFPTIAGRTPGVTAAIPLKLAQATLVGQLTMGSDGTWTLADGIIAGRSRESDVLGGFRSLGFCYADQNYALMATFLHDSLDVLADGQTDPSATCDAISLGAAFTAREATPGSLAHVDDLVECASAPVDGGSD